MMLIALGLVTLLGVLICDAGSLDFVLVPIDTSNIHTIVYLETQTYYAIQTDHVTLNISLSTRDIIESFETLEAVSYQFHLSNDEIPQYGVSGDTAIYITLSGVRDITGVTLKARFNNLATITVNPTSSLDSQYKIISYCQILGSCHVGFAGLIDKSTNIKITLPKDDKIEINVNGTTYYSEDVISVQLTNYQAILLECIKCELTNTIIDSSGSLAVFSGGSGTVVRKGVIESTFLTQMPPLSTWGKEFLLINSNIDDGRDIYRIVSRFPETTVNIDGFDSVTFGDRNHWIQRLINSGTVLHIVSNKPILICQLIYDGLNNAAMIVVPPVEQYSNNSFSLLCHDNIHLLFEGNSWNTIHIKEIENGTLSIISNSRFVARSYDIINDSNAFCHVRNDGSIFALVSVNLLTADDHIDIQYISGYRLKKIPVSSPKTVIPGDLVDNDGDGKIDEDDCSAISDSFHFHKNDDSDYQKSLDECTKEKKVLAKLNTTERYEKAIEYLLFQGSDVESDIYIGLQKSASTEWKYEWTDGELLTDAKWYIGYPQHQDITSCVAISIKDFTLVEYDCGTKLSVLCTDWADFEGKDCKNMPSGTQDHKGISFLFPVWDLSLNTGLVNLDLSATRSSSKPVNLHVYRQGRLDVSAPSQTFSDSFIHSFNNISVGISDHMTVIRVESSNSDELSLQILLHQDNSGIKKSISTLLYPTDVWGLEYYAASYCTSSCESYCLITAASFNTKVGVLLRNYNVTVKVHSSSNVIKIADKLSFDILIDRYQYVVLKSTDDLTGTYIRGDNPISVICGSDFQKFTVAEQLLPVKYFSKDSFSNVFQLYDDSSLNMEYFIRVLTSQSDTICSISTTGSNTFTSTEHLQRKGDYIQFPILESSDLHSINCNKPVQVWNIVIDNEVSGTMTIVPTSLQYYYSNTWHTPDATNGVVQKLYAYKTSTNFPLKYKDQSWSGTKGFVTKLLEATTYTTTTDHYNITFFLWSIGHQDGYAFGTHLAMTLFEQSTCHLGQTADEDCDGHTEEELCTLLGYHFVPEKYIFEVGKYLPDFDLDGNYDEDCAYIVPDCRKPMIPNTTISDYTTASTTYVTSTFSKFNCEEGFTFANTSVPKIECYADGKWMPERICIKDCPDPSTVYNNSEIVNGTSFAVRSSVMMNCVDNFTLIGHDVLECTENGTWTIDVFYCSPDCVDPVTVYDNSVIEHGTSWAVGNNITMACMDGFTLLGDNILKCTNDSIWSKDVFSCAADCTDPTPAVQYSEVINPSGLSTFPVDDEYSLTCKTGYSVNGKSVMTCYTNSTWSQPQFSCVPGCGDPRKDIPHSVILNYTEGKPFDAGIDLVMACKTSTTQVGEETVVCLTDKTWNKTLKCIPDCSDPRLEVEVENATLTGFKTGSTTAYKSQYKFRCNLKYRMIGNSYIVCLENSTWSQPQFYCEPCKCPCRRVGVPRYTEVTPEVVNQIQVETSLDLAVNEKILSAYIRLKTSVPNKKQVAKSIGYVGAAFLVVILGSIVLLDIPTLWKHLKHLINRINNFYRYMRH